MKSPPIRKEGQRYGRYWKGGFRIYRIWKPEAYVKILGSRRFYFQHARGRSWQRNISNLVIVPYIRHCGKIIWTFSYYPRLFIYNCNFGPFRSSASKLLPTPYNVAWEWRGERSGKEEEVIHRALFPAAKMKKRARSIMRPHQQFHNISGLNYSCFDNVCFSAFGTAATTHGVLPAVWCLGDCTDIT